MTPQTLTRLNTSIERDIPLARAAGVRLAAGTNGTLAAHAPLALNGNPHGSAFGGSLYVTALVAGYAQCVLWVEQAGMRASVVIGHAEARYQRPVHGDIMAQVEPVEPGTQARFINTLRRHGRARIQLTVTVDSDRIKAFELRARFAAIRPSDDPAETP